MAPVGPVSPTPGPGGPIAPVAPVAPVVPVPEPNDPPPPPLPNALSVENGLVQVYVPYMLGAPVPFTKPNALSDMDNDSEGTVVVSARCIQM